MLKLNSIPQNVFEANETPDIKFADISRKDVVSTGRVIACEYIGSELFKAGKEAYNSRLKDGKADYATLSRAHQDKKLLFCAAQANKMMGKEAPRSIDEVKKNPSYARNDIFLRTMAEIDKDVLQPLFFNVLDSVSMGLMQWDSAEMGRTTEIEIGSNDVFFFEDSAFGSGRSTSKNYLYKDSITLTPKMYSCNATIKWYSDIVNGDAGRYYAAIMNGMYNKIYAMMLNGLKTAVSGGKYIPAGLTAETYSTANWIAISDLVAAANGVSVDNLLAIGTRSALSNLLPVDGTGGQISGLQYGLGAEWFKNGYLPKAGGVDLLAVTPVIVPGTQNSTLDRFDTGNDIYIVAKAGYGYAPMRGVYAEGSPIILTASPSQTADFTIDINVGALFDIKPLFASKIGVIKSVYPSA